MAVRQEDVNVASAGHIPRGETAGSRFSHSGASLVGAAVVVALAVFDVLVGDAAAGADVGVLEQAASSSTAAAARAVRMPVCRIGGGGALRGAPVPVVPVLLVLVLLGRRLGVSAAQRPKPRPDATDERAE
jgi:hypothetical protein